MNPKSSVRFSIDLKSGTRPTYAPQYAKAVYTRCTASQPGYYLIRLRLQRSRTLFRPTINLP